MKKILVLAIGVLALMSCNNEVKQVEGTYSYKISGQAIVKGDTLELNDEIGAMTIEGITSDSTLVTFNALNGPAYATGAKISKKEITLAPFTRAISVRSQDYRVTAEGEGSIYNETILITLSYNSDDVQADSLTLLCNKN